MEVKKGQLFIFHTAGQEVKVEAQRKVKRGGKEYVESRLLEDIFGTVTFKKGSIHYFLPSFLTPAI